MSYDRYRPSGRSRDHAGNTKPSDLAPGKRTLTQFPTATDVATPERSTSPAPASEGAVQRRLPQTSEATAHDPQPPVMPDGLADAFIREPGQRSPAAETRQPIQMRGPTERTREEAHGAATRGITAPQEELPHRELLEGALQQDLSDVRAHVGGDAEKSAHAMGAEAYATGDHVVLPSNPSLSLVAHEVTHVLQQRDGVHLQSGLGQAGDEYEVQADAVADCVARGESAAGMLDAGTRVSSTPHVQRKQASPDASIGGPEAQEGDETHLQRVEGEGDILATALRPADNHLERIERATDLALALQSLDHRDRRILRRRVGTTDSEDRLGRALASMADHEDLLLGVLDGTRRVDADARRNAQASASDPLAAAVSSASDGESTATEVPHRAAMESAFGQSLGDVTAHTGRDDVLAPLGARAAAQGDTVVFADRSPSPEVVAHEVTHSLQQRNATSPATTPDVASASSPAEAEASAIAAHVGAGQPGTVDVTAVPEAGIHLDRGHAAPPAQAVPPEDEAADFLTHLRERHFHVSPRPLVVPRHGSGQAVVIPAARRGPPLGTEVARLRWRLVDARRPIAQGDVPWPALMAVAPPFVLPIPAVGVYAVEIEVEIPGRGKRELAISIEAIAPEIENLLDRDDEEVAAHRDGLQERLSRERDPATRALLTRAFNTAEWEASQRGIPPTANPDEARAPSIYPDQVPKWVPSDPASMRAWIEREIGARGWDRGRDEVRARVNSMLVGATFAQQQMAREQLALLEADMAAFAERFEGAAFTTAHAMLTQSTQAIGGVIGSYGLGGGSAVSRAADAYIRDEDSLGAEVERIVALATKQDQDDPGGRAAQRAHRGDLAAVVENLVQRQGRIDELVVRYDEIRKARWAREHNSHHRRPEGVAAFPEMSPALREQIHGIDRARQARGISPLDFSMPMPEIAPPISEEERATTLLHQLTAAQQSLRSTWAQAEAEHPILIAYRGENGADGHRLHGLNSGDDEAMRGMLRTIVPKVADIKRASAGIKSSRPHPYRLDNVVSLTKQRMLVPPGSVRDAVVTHKVEEAGEGPIDAAVLAAITLALAAITFVPSGGTSTLLIVADLGALALDTYMAVNAYADYAQMKPTANTSLDRAHALASEEPSLTWLAIDIISAGLGAASVARTWRQAVAVRRAAEAGDSAQAAIRELNELGRQHSLGDDLGDRVARTGADDATPGIARASGDARAYARELGGLAAERADDLARRIGTGVEIDPRLEGGRIDIDFDDAGDHVWVIGIRIAPDATFDDVLAHRAALERMRRYNGGVGELRRLMDRAGGALGARGELTVGSDTWRAFAEVEKLTEEVAARRRALRGKPLDSIAKQLEAEIDFLEGQIARYQTTLADAGGGTRLTENVVSSPSLSQARREAQEEGLVMPGAFGRSGKGPAPIPPGALPGHVGTAVETTVDEATRLSHIRPRDAVNEWMEFAASRDPDALRAAVAQRARNAALEANEQIRMSFLYRDFANADPEAAKRVIRSAYHQAAENYFVRLEKAAHEMHAEMLRRAARRGRGANRKGDLDKLEDVMDALGTKPVGGRLPPNAGLGGSFIHVDDLEPEIRELVEQAGLSGISFTRGGDPDFTPWVYRDGDIVGDVDIGQLTGNRDRDFIAAEVKAGITRRPRGYTWHHHEGARLVLVPTEVHDAAKHAGPSALYDAVTGTRSYNRPKGDVRDIPWEPLR